MCFRRFLIISFAVVISQCQFAINEKNQCLQDQFLEKKQNCSNLTELEKGVLSFMMMNCHYQRSGRKTVDCNYELNDLQSCTRQLDSNYWNIFTQFYILIQHFCQIQILRYLQSNVESKLSLISIEQQFLNTNLKQQSSIFSEILGTQNEIQNQTQVFLQYVASQYLNFNNQRENEEQNQKIMIEYINEINSQVHKYHNEIEHSFQELSSIYQIAKYYIDLIYVQGVKMNQIFFYIIDLLLMWLFTSNKQFIDQRFNNFLLILICFALENYFESSNYIKSFLVVNQLLLILYGFIFYKDYEQLTYNKLMSIQKRINYFDLSNFKQRAKQILMNTVSKKRNE
ncbi:unnamed protein product [Paramecium octaurelia]|uniref:Transmembrane protein n=1 Tax=Paramecium octaurelia TaxID=43137 RepID=A0A8S1VPY8_PAROT|nr:unnamed protein product [Paramecium octaurelia]